MSSLGFHCHDVDRLEDIIVGNGLSRGEFYNLDISELLTLRKLILSHNLKWSIHSPLIKLDWYPNPPTWSFLCDISKDNRELTMKMVTLTMEHAQEFGVDYVVVHFPTPPSDASGESQEKIESIARSSCEWLAELSLKRGVPIHTEGVGASPLLNAEFLCQVLAEYTPLRYCFDTAHAYLAALNDGFDYYAFARDMSPYLGSVHLWNTRGTDDYIAFRHIPVHPSQSPDDGWVDIPRTLAALNANRSDLTLIFESAPRYPLELGDHDYRDGIKWVKSLLAT
ncbi:sugar phosphate isomerase/epimerase family protein [Chloroflexota bacterium]